MLNFCDFIQVYVFKAENHVTYFDYFVPVFGQNG